MRAPPVMPASRNITHAQVTAFVAVAQAEGFSAAARQLGVSQPSLSRSIMEMESALGYPLFERTSVGVKLSAGGESFLPRGRRLLAAHAEANHALANWRAAAQGRLKVVGSSSVMPLVLPTLKVKLEEAFGCATMEVQTALSGEVRRQVAANECVLGVCVDVVRDPALRYTPVLEAQLGLLASPRLSIPESISSLDDLATVPLLKFRDATPVCELLRHHGIRFDSYFSSPLTVNCILDSLDLAQQGHGAVVCSGVGASHARAAGLRFIPLPKLLPSGHIYVVSRRDSTFSTAQERLRELLGDSIRATCWHPSVKVIGGQVHKVEGPQVRAPGPSVRHLAHEAALG